MKVRIKETAPIEHYQGNRKVDFTGFTDILKSDGTVCFDKESVEKLPNGWIKQANQMGYNPYEYVFDEKDLEFI